MSCRSMIDKFSSQTVASTNGDSVEINNKAMYSANSHMWPRLEEKKQIGLS
jgi:hypothetical protein